MRFRFSWTPFSATAAILILASSAMAGSYESPINITSNTSVFANLPSLNLSLGSDVNLTVVNTGSPNDLTTIRAVVPTGGGSLSYGSETYNLAQFHFHSDSENEVNSVRFDMEMHLVFTAVDGSILVVGRFIEAGAFNAAMDPIFSALPQSITDSLTVNDFNLNNLLPSNLDSYRFSGSLTTPPYTTGVEWNVLADPMFMSQGQIDEFRALFPNGNVREVQPLNDRLVQTNVVGFSTIPEPSSAVLIAVGGIALTVFGRQRTRSSRTVGKAA